MLNCKDCLNNKICKFIDEAENLNKEVEKVSIKEETPFKIETNCNRYTGSSLLNMLNMMSKNIERGH